jgi:hypothetical protein
MLTVMWGVDGFESWDLMIDLYSFNSQHFIDDVIHLWDHTVDPNSGRANHMIPHYMCTWNPGWITVKSTHPRDQGNCTRRRTWRASPSHLTVLIWLFGDLKQSLARQTREELDDLFDAVGAFFEVLPVQKLLAVFTVCLLQMGN